VISEKENKDGGLLSEKPTEAGGKERTKERGR